MTMQQNLALSFFLFLLKLSHAHLSYLDFADEFSQMDILHLRKMFSHTPKQQMKENSFSLIESNISCWCCMMKEIIPVFAPPCFRKYPQSKNNFIISYILFLCVFARLWNDSRHGNKGKGQKNNQFVCISILWRNVYFKTKTSKTLEISNICKPNTTYISNI